MCDAKHYRAGVHFMVRSGFREYEVKKIAFSGLLQAGKRNVSSAYSWNPERTKKCTPVDHFCGTVPEGSPTLVELRSEDHPDPDQISNI